MPENTLADHFAAAFGGGPDRQGAYDEGRMHRARTEQALARAAEARDSAIARRNLRGQDLTNPNDAALADIIISGLGSDFSSTQQGRLRGQEYGFREQIADPATAMDQRQYSAQAVAGRPFNFLDTMGQGHYADIRDPDAGVQQTALGDALVGATEALEAERMASAGAAEALETQRLRPDAGRQEDSLEDVAMEALARDLAQYSGWTEDAEGNRSRDFGAARQELSDVFGPDTQPVPEISPTVEVVPAGIPQGSQLIGHTASGAPVYRTPDGQQLVAD